MKGGTVQINWHDTKPVLTLDFHPVSGLLATGGADYDIKLWSINSGEANKEIPTASYQSSLSYHGSAVNILRFSPSGDQLASGADGGELIIWKFHLTETGQAWKVLKSLSFHRKDVLDMEWSTDGAFLVSGSVDNSCIIWDVNKGSVVQILDAHCHYVQGVAWDPLAKYVASLSSDRTCRIYANKPSTKSKGSQKLNYICQHIIAKAETDDSKSAKSYLFHDETLPSFFRRLAWSPDGSFLLVPAGSCRTSPTTETMNVTYVFSRRDLSRPALQLPGASKPVIAVRFCPLAFSLRGSNSAGFFKLPYRLIYAVATLNSLYIYDTESVPPIAILAGLHYAAVTDIAWSHNARYLAISSQDGYCTLVEFENDELGSPVPLSGNKASGDEDKSSAIEKPEDMIIATTNDNIVLADSTPMELERSGTEIGKIEVEREAGETTMTDGPIAVDSKSMDAEMKEGKALTKDSLVAGSERKEVDGSRTEAGIKEGKQQLPASTGVSVQNKPAKRRITPMAIDP